MKITVRDPGHVVLRRAVRAAIAVPVTATLALVLLPRSPAGLVAVFGSLCLTAICDFGGPPRRRLLSLVGAGATGAVVIALGVLGSQNMVTAVLVTAIVGAALAFSSVLRGSVASGAPAMTIMYVVAATLGVPAGELGKQLVGWALALAIAIPVTLLVLPRRGLAPVREACAAALSALSDAVQARGRGEQADADALVAAHDALRRSYLGNPFRAAGLSARDHALITLAGQVQGVLAAVIHGRGFPTPLPDHDVTRNLNQLSATALADAGEALAHHPSKEPSGLTIVSEWRLQWDRAVDMVATSPGDGVPARVHAVADMFPDRTMAVATVRMVMLVRRVLGLPDEQYPTGPDIPSIPAPPVQRGGDDLRAELTLRSPWARLALRTGAGLALAVLVVSLTGLAHGLWVVLGVVAVLRVDGLTTLKTAMLAVVGTFVGAAIGYGLLAADSSHFAWLWLTLILATFLAVWLPGAVGFAVGQAAFSIFVIVAFTLLTWPPDLATAADRFEDVLVGALVSVVVALLLWPRGVLAGAMANVSEAVRTTSRLLHDAVTSLVRGGDVEPALMTHTTASIARAQEVVELLLGSTRPGAADYAFRWQTLIDHVRNPAVAGRLLAGWSHGRPAIDSVLPQMDAPLITELELVVREWEGVADAIDSGTRPDPVNDPDTLAAIASIAAAADMTQPDVADRLVASIWGHGWMQMSLRAGTSCEVPNAG